VFIALGSNLGDREAHLRDALRELSESGAVRIVRCSSLHETAPVGGRDGQGPYLNAVAEIETRLPPRELLVLLHRIEERHGRTRGERNGPRTLDLDLLLYGEQAICEPDLTVPHPRMWGRPFVLEPLAELCGPQELERLRELAVRNQAGVTEVRECSSTLRPGG
jgi:2-amino-4-hydroxy-6-hydroxymethyldihydropteridine diphosphokinase